MRHFYLLHTFCQLLLRLGLSGGLLLSSAGLGVAASLLFYRSATTSTMLATEYATCQPSITTFMTAQYPVSAAPVNPLVSFRPVGQPPYWFANDARAGHRAAGLLPAPSAHSRAAISPPGAAAAGTVKATLRRSWHTIKLAFR